MPITGTRARAIARAAFSLLAVTAAINASPATAAATARCSGATTAPAGPTLNRADHAVVCLVNAERTRRGLHPLRPDGRLARAARGHAADMVQRTYFSHVAPGGADLGDRVRHAGYARGNGWKAGETIGWGQGSLATPAALVREWIASPPHRRILLDPAFRELGVGIATGSPSAATDAASATYAVDFGVVR